MIFTQYKLSRARKIIFRRRPLDRGNLLFAEYGFHQRLSRLETANILEHSPSIWQQALLCCGGPFLLLSAPWREIHFALLGCIQGKKRKRRASNRERRRRGRDLFYASSRVVSHRPPQSCWEFLYGSWRGGRAEKRRVENSRFTIAPRPPKSRPGTRVVFRE